MTNKTAQESLDLQQEEVPTGPVECLGKTFESEEARRAHFTEELREKLQDPSFRAIPGFPNASDEDILRMSDPPFYTACPNPFLEDFVEVHATPYDPTEPYDREPFAVDVSEGKYDWLYRAHPYHTKVPHLAIAPSILHYTKPGDLVLDGFCGSGMTGVAAQWCGTAPNDYRKSLAAEWKTEGHKAPEWGARRVVLNDLGPAATFIAAGYNLPFDFERFERAALRIVAEVEDEVGWMYETLHTDGTTNGRINYTVWSEVFSCPECAGEVTFVEEALDEETKKTLKEFPCPHCQAELTKRRLDTFYVTRFDEVTGESYREPKRVPVLINYNVGSETYERPVERDDVELLRKIERLSIPSTVPTNRMMDHSDDVEVWGDKYRAGTASFTHVHHLFLPRAAHVLAMLWEKANAESDPNTRRTLLFSVEQIITTGSLLNRYRPSSSFGNGPLRGVYYISSQIAETSIFLLFDGILRRMNRGFSGGLSVKNNQAGIQTGDCASLGIPDRCIDYIFTDPPFGANFAYAELNFVVEAWHGVRTAMEREAIESPHQDKSTLHYQELMRNCFREYCRVLKPGRWITVVFSNNNNAVWRAIQEAMGTAGFVVADVRTLDKKQGTFNQVAGHTVKQDLIISAYKPTEKLEESFELSHVGADSAWAFVKEHLRNVPVFVGRANEGEVVAERTAQMLLDRMIAFHVQRGVSVPVSGPEFLQGLAQRFPERDDMYFLSDQVAEYDRKRTTVGTLRQLDLFVSDEASAIQWVRQQLHDKPQTFQDLQPQFMPETQGWAKHEKQPELKAILNENFLHYDGTGPVPSQIHSYLSTNFKDLRNLDKEDPQLQEKARDRWYVPDPNKQADIDKLRERTLLKEFEEYKTSKQRKLKVFRTEAVRAGFKSAWQDRDYGMIVKVAEKLPLDVLQEDPTLLMYYDNALTRMGDE